MKSFNSNQLVHSIFLSGFGVLGLLFVFLLKDIYFSLVLFSLYCLWLITHYNDRSFTHPILVFTLFYYPYSTWFVFYTLLNSVYDLDVLLSVVQYSYLGILSFALMGFLFEIRPNLILLHEDRKPFPVSIFNSPTVFKIVYWSVVILMAASIISIVSSGATTKREVVDLKILLVNLSGYFAIFLTILVSIRKKIDIDKKGKFVFLDYFSLVALCLFGIFYLVGGERDYVFRLIFVMIIMYFYCEKSANILKILAISIGVVLTMPLTQAFKSFLISNHSESMHFGQLDIFGGEFISAAKNLYMVIYYDANGSYSLLLKDFIKGVVPFSSNLGLDSSGSWYNSIFRYEIGVDGTSGWGFSLVAEGYVVDGSLGVIVVMLLVSLILHFLYRRMYKSTYWFVFYLLALSTSIYCIRSDVANFISQTFKISGMSIFAIWLCTVVSKKITHLRRI